MELRSKQQTNVFFIFIVTHVTQQRSALVMTEHVAITLAFFSHPNGASVMSWRHRADILVHPSGARLIIAHILRAEHCRK